MLSFCLNSFSWGNNIFLICSRRVSKHILEYFVAFFVHADYLSINNLFWHYLEKVRQQSIYYVCTIIISSPHSPLNNWSLWVFKHLLVMLWWTSSIVINVSQLAHVKRSESDVKWNDERWVDECRKIRHCYKSIDKRRIIRKYFVNWYVNVRVWLRDIRL